MNAMMRRAIVLLLVFAGTANARPASKGFYAEAGFGAVAFVPPDSKNANVGPTMDLRIGRDLFSWMSIGLVVAASSHEATVPAPPEGEWFQMYRGAGDARIGGLAGSVAFFVEGGAGLTLMSSNILERSMTLDPGERWSITFHGGAGLEYQLVNRHYAIGVAAAGFIAPQFSALKAIESRLYLRYTYGGG
jgi:hypothetical protein